MGVGYEMICHTCQTRTGLGYGGYKYWIIPKDHMTLEEFDKQATVKNMSFERNRRTQQALVKHKGHNYQFLSEDMLDYEGLGLKAQNYRQETEDD